MVVGRMAGNGLRGEGEREAVTIYVKRRGKETDEKNDDGSLPPQPPTGQTSTPSLLCGAAMATSFTTTSN